MRRRLILLLLCCIPLIAADSAHKYYVSVSDITYSESSASLQIISRYFTDDLDMLLGERYGIEARLMADDEPASSEAYLKKYLAGKFRVYINGKLTAFEFLGKEYDNDLTKCYMEIPGVSMDSVKSIRVESEVLYDLFEDQQNIIHLQFPDKKKSFLLHKENYKAMLNF